MNFQKLQDKNILVMGLGLHGGGLGVVKFLQKQGAKIIITDLKESKHLESSLRQIKQDENTKIVLGQHRFQDFENADLIIKNPAVPIDSPYLKNARKKGVTIETEITLFFKLCPAPIIGITGSKGKSTVTSLLYKLLNQKYDDLILAGNIRKSALLQLEKISKKSLVILELSSWQLHELKNEQISPHIALITNILPDHLNRYNNIEEYIDDKKQIFKWQNKNDYLILNYNNSKTKQLSREAKAQLFFYALNSANEIKNENLGAFLKNNKIFYKDKKNPICNLEKLTLKGEHNISNVLASITIAKIFNLSNQNIINGLADFHPPEGRMETIRTIQNIEYINDTTATIPDATIAALKTLFEEKSKNIILITGGTDKNLDFKNLAFFISKMVKAVILLKGSATKKLQKELKQELQNTDNPPFVFGSYNNIEKAVKKAKNISQDGDIVLFSPASSSFEMFQHEFERGDAFKKSVNKIEAQK